MNYGQQSADFKDRWDRYTNPSTDNYFYHHFKKHISDDLISTKIFPKETSKIIIEFNLDSLYFFTNIRTNISSKIIENEIIAGFKELDFEKIKIHSASAMHNYSLQIMAIENGEAILKCSSSVLHEIPPIMEGCEKNYNYKDYNKCFNANLNYFIETSLDSANINPISLENELKIYSKINFNKTKELKILAVKSEDSLLSEATIKALEKFNYRFRPATLNGNKDDYSLDLVVNSDNIGYQSAAAYFKNASSENELSKHFKNELSQELISLPNFNLKNNNVTLSFYVNKKNELEQIKTNADDKRLDEAIIEAFKKFPFSKLTIPNKSPLNNYGIQVITFENNKNIIKCSEPLVIETLPILYGCENSKSVSDLKKCNQDAMNRKIIGNFDTNAGRRIGKTGTVRIFAVFKIDKLGKIADIRVKALHKDLELETIRVLKKIKVLKPGFQRGKPVAVKYSLPIAFKIPEKKVNQKNFGSIRN